MKNLMKDQSLYALNPDIIRDLSRLSLLCKLKEYENLKEYEDSNSTGEIFLEENYSLFLERFSLK